jgi:hypothetical protein
MTNPDAMLRGLVFRTAPTGALTAGLPGCRRFLAVAARASNDRNPRIPDDWNRRLCRENDSALLFDAYDGA